MSSGYEARTQDVDLHGAGTEVDGRKRHIAVDRLGLPPAVEITTANLQDRDRGGTPGFSCVAG
jgi:hypothetical protein